MPLAGARFTRVGNLVRVGNIPLYAIFLFLFIGRKCYTCYSVDFITLLSRNTLWVMLHLLHPLILLLWVIVGCG
jgi:hypothetical protein